MDKLIDMWGLRDAIKSGNLNADEIQQVIINYALENVSRIVMPTALSIASESFGKHYQAAIQPPVCQRVCPTEAESFFSRWRQGYRFRPP